MNANEARELSNLSLKQSELAPILNRIKVAAMQNKREILVYDMSKDVKTELTKLGYSLKDRTYQTDHPTCRTDYITVYETKVSW